MGRGFTDLGPTQSPVLLPIPCPPLVSPLECPGGNRLSTLTPTRGPGALPWPVGRTSVCFSALPAIWATPFLLASPLCKMLLCPSTQCSGVSKASAGYQAIEASSRSPLTRGMPLVWTTLSTKQTGLIQSFCLNPDFQDPGQPSRPRPHQMGTSHYQLYHYCTCPVCAGERGCLFNKPPAHFLGLPQGKEPLANP